jgi:hypothetical protein
MPLTDLNIENQAYINQEALKDTSWMAYQIGDIFKRTDLNMIIHSTNCFHNMSSGISYKVKENYINAFLADKKTQFGSIDKLGTFSSSLDENINNKQELMIINLYGQYNPGTCEEHKNAIDSKENRFLYLKESLNKFADFLKLYNIDSQEENKCQFIIGVPWLIGCGAVSGGDYNEIFNLFKEIFSSMSNVVKIVFVDING